MGSKIKVIKPLGY